MEMSFEDRNSMRVVRLQETRLDASVAIRFKDLFRDLTQSSDADVVLDMTTVEFLDSSGLGAVVAARKLLGGNRSMALAGLTPAVDKVMTLTRMHTVFPIHTDLDAALAAGAADHHPKT